MASEALEDILTKSGVDSTLTNALMMEGWTCQTFRMAAADSQGFEDVLHEWSSKFTYTTEEIRAFRHIPDYTAQFIQEFHTYLTLSEDNGTNGRIGTINEVYFHVLICEGLVPYAQADFTGMDPDEIAYRLALAIAVASKTGFRLRDCGRGNWSFGLRNGRIVPLLLDGNSWTRLEDTDELYGKWPPKKLIGTFWTLLSEVHGQAAAEIYQEVYHPSASTQFDSDHTCDFLLRRLAGLDTPQTWNPLIWSGAFSNLSIWGYSMAFLQSSSFQGIVILGCSNRRTSLTIFLNFHLAFCSLFTLLNGYLASSTLHFSLTRPSSSVEHFFHMFRLGIILPYLLTWDMATHPHHCIYDSHLRTEHFVSCYCHLTSLCRICYRYSTATWSALTPRLWPNLEHYS